MWLLMSRYGKGDRRRVRERGVELDLYSSPPHAHGHPGIFYSYTHDISVQPEVHSFPLIAVSTDLSWSLPSVRYLVDAAVPMETGIEASHA